MIIHYHAGWSLTGNRKQKKLLDFWAKKWSGLLKKFEQWSPTRGGRYERVDNNKENIKRVYP